MQCARAVDLVVQSWESDTGYPWMQEKGNIFAAHHKKYLTMHWQLSAEKSIEPALTPNSNASSERGAN